MAAPETAVIKSKPVRLNNTEKKPIDTINKTKNFFPFQTHELMPNIKLPDGNSLNFDKKVTGLISKGLKNFLG